MESGEVMVMKLKAQISINSLFDGSGWYWVIRFRFVVCCLFAV